MLKNPPIVFTFTRQRSRSTSFSSYLALPVWRSNALYLIPLLLSYCNMIKFCIILLQLFQCFFKILLCEGLSVGWACWCCGPTAGRRDPYSTSWPPSSSHRTSHTVYSSGRWAVTSHMNNTFVQSLMVFPAWRRQCCSTSSTWPRLGLPCRPSPTTLSSSSTAGSRLHLFTLKFHLKPEEFSDVWFFSCELQYWKGKWCWVKVLSLSDVSVAL